jgi:hypothetical protein
MAKDPAFLFYHQDFFTGVSDMTNEEVGAYIRCLCIQAAKGGITEKHMLNICNSYEIDKAIKSKFIFDPANGFFYNERLRDEIEKRKKYSESRANNRKSKKSDSEHMNNISSTYDKHMENENENEIVIRNTEKGLSREKHKPSSPDEVGNYFLEIGLPYTEGQKFWDHFSSNGWKIGGKAPMKDWKAACRTWKRNHKPSPNDEVRIFGKVTAADLEAQARRLAEQDNPQTQTQ